MAVSTTITEGELVAEHWEDIFLKEFRNDNVFYDLGMKGKHPMNSGDIVHWLSLADLSANSVALTEGTDPTEYTLSAGDLTAQLAQYGDSVLLSDLFQDTGVGRAVDEIVERLGYHAKRKTSLVVRDAVLSAATVVQYGGSAVARNSIATDGSFDFDVTTIRKAVRFFKKANAMPLGGPEGDYVAVADPDVIYDIQGDSNWTNAQIYTNNVEKVYSGEVGKMYGTRFVENTDVLELVASGSASTDVFQTYFFAEGGLGISELYAPKVIIKNPHPASDLDLYGSYGWKAAFATRELKPSALLRVETGASLAD